MATLRGMLPPPLSLVWWSHHPALIIFINLSLGLLGIPMLAETLLLLTGALVWQGHASLWSAFVASVAGSAVGMTFSFQLGRAAQSAVHGSVTLVRRSQRHVERAQTWCARFGSWAVMLAYFTPGLRHATAIAVGTTTVSRRRFVALAVCGACAWSSMLLW